MRLPNRLLRKPRSRRPPPCPYSLKNLAVTVPLLAPTLSKISAFSSLSLPRLLPSVRRHRILPTLVLSNTSLSPSPRHADFFTHNDVAVPLEARTSLITSTSAAGTPPRILQTPPLHRSPPGLHFFKPLGFAVLRPTHTPSNTSPSVSHFQPRLLQTRSPTRIVQSAHRRRHPSRPDFFLQLGVALPITAPTPSHS